MIILTQVWHTIQTHTLIQKYSYINCGTLPTCTGTVHKQCLHEEEGSRLNADKWKRGEATVSSYVIICNTLVFKVAAY